MFGRSPQHLLYIRSLRICGPDSIGSFRQGNGPAPPQVYNGFRFARKAVNVAQRMIV